MNIDSWKSDIKKLLRKRKWDTKEWHRAIGVNQRILEKLLYEEIKEPDMYLLEMTYELTKKSVKSKLLRFTKPNIIAYWSYKGGTGKTTYAANMGFELATRGYNVLEIDSDGQTNLSGVLFPDFPALKEQSFFDAISFQESFKKHIITTEYDNLDLVPGNLRGEGLDAVISVHSTEGQQKIWRKCMDELIEDNYYDFILIDMDKAISQINKLILNNVDYLISPIEDGMFSIQAVPAIQSIVKEISSNNKEFRFLGFAFNKVDKRRKRLEESRDLVESSIPGCLFDNYLSTSADVDNSQREHMPIGYYSKSCMVNKQIASITDEFLNKIKDK